MCNIFNHQATCFKCHKQRDHGWDDWSSLSHTRFICAESTDFFSHNPPPSIFGVTEEDKHAGDFFSSLPTTICHSFSSVCAEKQSNPGDFPLNPKWIAASGEAGGAASHRSSGPVVESLHDECGYHLLMLKMIQVAPSKESAELSGHFMREAEWMLRLTKVVWDVVAWQANFLQIRFNFVIFAILKLRIRAHFQGPDLPAVYDCKNLFWCC